MLDIVVIDIVWCRVTFLVLWNVEWGAMDISHNFPTMELISAGEFRRTSFQVEVENRIELN